MKRRQTLIMGILGLLLLWGGCTQPYVNYAGPPRSETDIAVLTPQAGVKIHSLDGKVVNVGAEKSWDWVRYNRLHLRPGQYTLTLIPSDIGTIKTFTRLTVAVEAGRRYRVASQFYPGSGGKQGFYKFWVDDEKTGEVVSDIAESRNPFQP